MRLGLFIVLIWLMPACLSAAPLPLEQNASIDILYINANAGEAAGGHTALRLGNTIYHYQFFPDNTFLLVRDHWSSFYFLYNELHNRTIAVASIPLAQTAFTAIKRHFNELLIEQQLAFNTLDRLKTQLELSRALTGVNGQVTIPHLGFFHQAPEGETIRTKNLRHALQAQLGQKALGAETKPSQTLLEMISWQEAIKILQGDFSLTAGALLPPVPGEPVLDPQRLQQLEQFKQHQLQSIITLIKSSRPDKGGALLLQIARYLAVQKTIAAKQFYTLDPFPDQARTVSITDGEELQSLPQIEANLLRQSRQRTSLFFQEKNHQEIAYSLLELSRARVVELHRARNSNRQMRILAKLTLPTRSKTISLTPYAALMTSPKTDINRLEAELETQQQEIRQKYNYNLFVKNCATELIRALNTSFTTKEEGTDQLGGWLEPDNGLVFIPFLLYDKSLTTFPVQEEEMLTSRRLRLLEQLYANENDVLVWLRESNTLSSTLYQPRAKDTPFLFFTDNTLLLRPLQGILNLGYASLHTVAGLLSLPFDRGDHLHQASLGMLYSLPEIVFFNIRKGSYANGEHL